MIFESKFCLKKREKTTTIYIYFKRSIHFDINRTYIDSIPVLTDIDETQKNGTCKFSDRFDPLSFEGGF